MAGYAVPSASAGGTDSRQGNVLGGVKEVLPRPQHPQLDLFNVLRRIETPAGRGWASGSHY